MLMVLVVSSLLLEAGRSAWQSFWNQMWIPVVDVVRCKLFRRK